MPELKAGKKDLKSCVLLQYCCSAVYKYGIMMEKNKYKNGTSEFICGYRNDFVKNKLYFER